MYCISYFNSAGKYVFFKEADWATAFGTLEEAHKYKTKKEAQAMIDNGPLYPKNRMAVVKC